MRPKAKATVTTTHPKSVRAKPYTPYIGESKGTDHRRGVCRTKPEAMRITPSAPIAI